MKTNTDIVNKVLKKAYKIIECGWCKDSFAKNKKGKEVRYLSKDATNFCIMGAVKLASKKVASVSLNKSNLTRAVVNRLTTTMQKDTTKDYYDLVNFNDNQNDKRSVLRLIKRALAA